jgi:hypothetical protein
MGCFAAPGPLASAGCAAALGAGCACAVVGADALAAESVVVPVSLEPVFSLALSPGCAMARLLRLTAKTIKLSLNSGPRTFHRDVMTVLFYPKVGINRVGQSAVLFLAALNREFA